MILRIEDIKDICSNILLAVDSNELSKITETLELKVKDKTLFINVTNKEYYVTFKVPLFEDIDFHATVNAELFLNLIKKTTTETIELTLADNYLILKGNGTYKLPLIYENDKLLELPEIKLDNITNAFSVSSKTLKSIDTFNSVEIKKGVVVNPVQKLYYVDKQGAITFTSGACVNDFTLDEDIKLLFNSKIVKLFNIFNEDNVLFSIAQDTDDSGVNQTKVKFETSSTVLTAILYYNDDYISSVPVTQIRSVAKGQYAFTVMIPKQSLSEAIDRLTLFKDTRFNVYGNFEFKSDKVIIWDDSKENFEEISYTNNPDIQEPYNAILDFNDIKLGCCDGQYVSTRFGNHQSFVFDSHNNSIHSVVPECEI